MVVREFAKLTTCEVVTTLDQATVSSSAFAYLCQLAGKFRAGGAQLLEVEGTQWLRLDNYVGILETPCGTTLEILPKHCEGPSTAKALRALLVRMIHSALDLPARDAGPAHLTLFDAPLSEWVRRQFLLELELLVKRGIKFDYSRVEEEQRHLRGQLDVVRQLRQSPDRRHYFHTRHDVFSPDFVENRLLKAALERVAHTTQDPFNWRMSHELLQVLAEVPASRAYREDFIQWRGGRLLAKYSAVRPWCQLVLGQQLPLAVQGEWHGISLLFPMEKLFERFVGAALRSSLPACVRIAAQSRSAHLCEHAGEGFFHLRPDFVVERGGTRYVLDAKWKLLQQTAREKRYGIAQGDFYQLFAYGHKYIDPRQAKKELVLIYPQTSSFVAPLEPFNFEPGMTLWVVPFALGEIAGQERLILSPQMELAKNQILPGLLDSQVAAFIP